jgi:hypothetical protein
MNIALLIDKVMHTFRSTMFLIPILETFRTHEFANAIDTVAHSNNKE